MYLLGWEEETNKSGWLDSRLVSVLDSGAEGPGFKSTAAMLSGNSLKQTVPTHPASVQKAAKLVAALLRVAGITAGLAESNGSLLPGLWLTSPAGWLPRTGISSGTLRSVIEYGLPLPFYSGGWITGRRTCLSLQSLYISWPPMQVPFSIQMCRNSFWLYC